LPSAAGFVVALPKSKAFQNEFLDIPLHCQLPVSLSEARSAVQDINRAIETHLDVTETLEAENCRVFMNGLLRAIKANKVMKKLHPTRYASHLPLLDYPPAWQRLLHLAGWQYVRRQLSIRHQVGMGPIEERARTRRRSV
jgi:hypothetical protein